MQSLFIYKIYCALFVVTTKLAGVRVVKAKIRYVMILLVLLKCPPSAFTQS